MKRIFFTILTVFFLTSSANCANYADSLKIADSLFKEKKYPQSYAIYSGILSATEKFSPRMLLKMAMIKEQEGDYTMALYYLTLLYKYQPDKRVLDKMDELASAHHLTGYTFTDLEYFISLYNQYYYYLIFFFLIVSAIIYLYLIFKKFHSKKLGLRPLLFAVVLSFAYILTNYDIVPMKGIVCKDHSYLMSGPSAGADPVAEIEKGHRVIVWSENDVWYRISWNGEFAYIKKNHLLLVGDKNHLNGASFSFDL
jgi:uncharacterized protein YgiM (DUF1202 family)